MAKNDQPEAAAPTEAPPQPYRRRLGEAAGSLGRPLREIMGEDVVVIALGFESDRKIKALADNEEAGVKRGQLVNATAGVITIEGQDAGGHGIRYFTFSPSLVDKLRSINPDELPMDARFVQRPLDNGQSVWDVE